MHRLTEEEFEAILKSLGAWTDETSVI
jgi:hypothetical protein